MNRIAITGATGMIGSALIRKCIAEKTSVLAFFRPDTIKLRNIPDSSLVQIIPCELSKLKYLKTGLLPKCDVFYHFGWEGTYGDSRNDTYLQNKNITYTLDAVVLAHKLNCSAFIGAGSQAEYGRADGKLAPDTPAFPENGYGVAKLCAGGLSRILAGKMNMRHVWSRILSVYGEGDNDYTMLMTAIIKTLAGETPSFTKGEQLWDYLHCDDAAEAFYRMGISGHDGAVYPLGSGQALPLREYILTTCRLCNKNIRPALGDMPYWDKQVMYLCADISNLTRDTGFVPTVNFEIGIKKTIEWYKRRKYGKDQHSDSML